MFNKNNLKNFEGKILYKKTILLYIKEIINELNKNPDRLNNLLEELEMDEKEFISFISGEEENNISFYDECLLILRKTK